MQCGLLLDILAVEIGFVFNENLDAIRPTPDVNVSEHFSFFLMHHSNEQLGLSLARVFKITA
jgi:hypothetical protein